MTTPESLQDPIKKNNGHHDYSESISDFLSDIDDLDDLDLSGIFNSKPLYAEEELVAADLVVHELIIEEPVAEEPITEESVAEELAADAEMRSNVTDLETEAETVAIEAKQDLDLASFDVDTAV
jgi:hypothetical protein